MRGQHSPLLTDGELQLLYQDAKKSVTSGKTHYVDQQDVGEFPSHRLGTGLDYEDSRAYQPGDDPRAIDWRLTARAGKPFTQLFREERKPEVFILLDRRSRMRFGTRVRLKAAQGARISALAAFAAAHQGWAVSGVILDPQPLWFHRSETDQGTWQWAHQSAAPCPPLNTQTEPALADLLPLIMEKTKPGAHVYLLSDFADLDLACEAHIVQLAQTRTVFAAHILDTAELELPKAGRLDLQGIDKNQANQVDLSDAATRYQYNKSATSIRNKHKQSLRRCGCHYVPIMAQEDSPETLIPLPKSSVQ